MPSKLTRRDVEIDIDCWDDHQYSRQHLRDLARALRAALLVVDAIERTWDHPLTQSGLKCDCKPCEYTRDFRRDFPGLKEVPK